MRAINVGMSTTPGGGFEADRGFDTLADPDALGGLGEGGARFGFRALAAVFFADCFDAGAIAFRARHLCSRFSA